MFDLSGRTALVTGGARGLGLAMARALGTHGARLLLMDRDPVPLAAAVAELAGEGIEALSMTGDVTAPADTVRAVEAMRSAWQRVDICVCNAGIAANVAAEEMTLEQWNAIVGVNLTGVFFTAQACARAMIEQRSGSIVTIASMSGIIVNVPQRQSAYNITKAGVIMATKSLAVEWAPHGIRVNAIAPGYMRTEMTAPYIADPALGGQWMRLTPMERPGEPHELGGAVVYLASDASSFVTGHTLVVDGGYSLPSEAVAAVGGSIDTVSAPERPYLVRARSRNVICHAVPLRTGFIGAVRHPAAAGEIRPGAQPCWRVPTSLLLRH